MHIDCKTKKTIEVFTRIVNCDHCATPTKYSEKYTKEKMDGKTIKIYEFETIHFLIKKDKIKRYCPYD